MREEKEEDEEKMKVLRCNKGKNYGVRVYEGGERTRKRKLGVRTDLKDVRVR